MTPGALSAAFTAQKLTKSVGSCVVVYDSFGDTADVLVRAWLWVWVWVCGCMHVCLFVCL
jgi:hypothetical protein